MTVQTIYKCDKCGSEQDTQTQFWTVGVTANNSLYSSDLYVVGKSMQVCRPCLESFGIYVKKRPEKETSTPEPTVEELIRELVRLCS